MTGVLPCVDLISWMCWQRGHELYYANSLLDVFHRLLHVLNHSAAHPNQSLLLSSCTRDPVHRPCADPIAPAGRWAALIFCVDVSSLMYVLQHSGLVNDLL
jgi:hypothetical protein